MKASWTNLSKRHRTHRYWAGHFLGLARVRPHATLHARGPHAPAASVSLSYSCCVLLTPSWPWSGCGNFTIWLYRRLAQAFPVRPPALLKGWGGLGSSQLPICPRLPALSLTDQADIIAPQTLSWTPFLTLNHPVRHWAPQRWRNSL